MAYGEGRHEEAAELLGGIEARKLDPGMAGHVAYVQGELAAKKEPVKALAYLDDARLLSPGTIVEEAALRRQIALLAAAGKADRYELLATQYLRRFPSSVYAGGFRQQFAAAIAVHTNAGEPGRLARLESMLGGVEQADRREVYLTIAKEAIAKGKVEMAKFAAATCGAPDGGEQRGAGARAALRGRRPLSSPRNSTAAWKCSAPSSEPSWPTPTQRCSMRRSGLLGRCGVCRCAGPEPAAAACPGDAAGQALAQARKSVAQVDEILSGADKR